MYSRVAFSVVVCELECVDRIGTSKASVFFLQAEESVRVIFVIEVQVFFFSSRRGHRRYWRDWSSDVCCSDMLWHYDEPFTDFSYLPTFYVCREARKFITVALSGDGGDEMFAGYKKYQRLSVRQMFQPFLRRPVRSLMAASAESVLVQNGRLQKTVSSYGMDAATMLLDMLTACFPMPALRTAARGALAETLKHYSPMDVVGPLLSKAPPKDVGLVNAMRYLDLKLTLAGDILVKVDRASMAVSLEVRPVYLHREVMALAGKIPPGLLVDRKQAKKALKSAFRPWLPNEILYRDKIGFGVPLT